MFTRIAEDATLIAEQRGRPEDRVSRPAVKQGIADFESWLPADLALVFPRPEVQKQIEGALGQRQPTEAQRAEAARIIFWLGRRWDMVPEAIARLVVGFSENNIARLLEEAGVSVRRLGRLQLDGLVIDRDHRRVVRSDGQVIAVTEREYEVLDYLASRPGEVIGAAELATEVFRRDDGSAVGVVKAHVSHLRKKLGGGLIHTVRGAGYRLGPGRDTERERLLQVLTESNGNLSRAARCLGIPYSTLHYRVQKHGLTALHSIA